jgi:integrase
MQHYGRFWSRLLGKRLLNELTADDLRHIQAKMLAKGSRSPQTINRYFAALRRILNLAIMEGKLTLNPVRGVKFFPEPMGRLRFLSEGEIVRLEEVVDPAHWPIIAFALETGLRLSEQFHARWDCVDTERGILTVPLSKSGRTRHVVLSDEALAILRSLSSWLHSPYLFPSPLNAAQPMQGRHFVVKVYEAALKQAGIIGTNWHTLRHTFASRKVMAGVDIRTVQELLGHSTITMTMRYAHLSPMHLKDAANKASLRDLPRPNSVATRSKTGSEVASKLDSQTSEQIELVEELGKRSGGAERVRTAASQFCRLLP